MSTVLPSRYIYENIICNKHRDPSETLAIFLAYVNRWVRKGLTTLTDCGVCDVLHKHAEWRRFVEQDSNMSYIHSAIFNVNRFAIHLPMSMIGVLLTWHHLMVSLKLSVVLAEDEELYNPHLSNVKRMNDPRLSSEDKAFSAMDISPVSILNHCMKGRCFSEDNALQTTRFADTQVLEVCTLNRLVRQSMVAHLMYNNRFLLNKNMRRMLKTKATIDFCQKETKTGKKNRVFATDRKKGMKLKTKTRHDEHCYAIHVCGTKKDDEENEVDEMDVSARDGYRRTSTDTANRVRKYMKGLRKNKMSMGERDLHDNELLSVTNPDKTLINLCAKSAMFANPCFSGCYVNGRQRCVYSSTGIMNKMADTNSLPDYRYLVERDWISRHRNTSSDTTALGDMGNQGTQDDVDDYISFHSKVRKEHLLPGVFVINTHYRPENQRDQEQVMHNSLASARGGWKKQTGNTTLNRASLASYAMESSFNKYMNSYRERISELDHSGKMFAHRQTLASNAKQHIHCRRDKDSATFSIKQLPSGESAESLKKSCDAVVSPTLVGDTRSFLRNWKRYVKHTGNKPKITKTRRTTNNALTEDMVSSYNMFPHGLAGKVEEQEALLAQNNKKKKQTQHVCMFLLQMFKLVTYESRMRMGTGNSHVEHIEAGTPMCMWCTLNVAEGMPLVLNDCVKMTKNLSLASGVGIGLSNSNCLTTEQDTFMSVSKWNKGVSRTDSIFQETPTHASMSEAFTNAPRSKIYTAALDRNEVSYENMHKIYSEWFYVKYKSVLADVFNAVYVDEQTLCIFNRTGTNMDDYMIISCKQIPEMLMSLHSHLSDNSYSMCKANIRRTFVDCDMQLNENTSAVPLSECALPDFRQAVETLVNNNVFIAEKHKRHVQRVSMVHNMAFPYVVC